MKASRIAATAGTYALFAGIATGANLAAQWVISSIWPWRWVNLVGMLAGTAVGVLVKYVLDKRWIFRFRSAGLWDDARRLLRYGFTGAATTLLFWGTELAFLALFASQSAKYAGAALGLAAGYTAKYFLDARFVFGAPAEPKDANSRRTPKESPGSAVPRG